MEAVTSLLAKMAVRRVVDYQTSPGYYSPYFLATKKDGSLRPILNLKIFNQYLVKEKFRMETLKSFLSTLEKGDLLISLDLKDIPSCCNTCGLPQIPTFCLPETPGRNRYASGLCSPSNSP